MYWHGGAGDPFAGIDSACAIALHMHQPLIPAGGGDLRSAALIGNLQDMEAHPDIGDNHNAAVFRWCYRRMGEFVPQLIDEGLQPRVMLEYSGTLLHGLRLMGADDVLEALQLITCDPRYSHAVEWLGCPWGHAVAPSTPVQDFRLHVRAWQQHFAALFGCEALAGCEAFSLGDGAAEPSRGRLRFRPHAARLRLSLGARAGAHGGAARWHGLERKHLPHRLVCRSSTGETASIVAIVKTQGSDTKLVAQMQPLYEARSLGRWELDGHMVPPLVTQIADGENGGVMMNEFPSKYLEAVREASGSQTPLLNGSEYLERLWASGVSEANLPVCQPLFQHRIWERMQPGEGPERLGCVIEEVRAQDDRFHLDGGSWTNDISWVRGYDDILIPMERASSEFHQRVLARNVPSSDPDYRKALFHLLSSETSCYRYWGEGIWTDYGAELARRTTDIVTHEL